MLGSRQRQSGTTPDKPHVLDLVWIFKAIEHTPEPLLEIFASFRNARDFFEALNINDLMAHNFHFQLTPTQQPEEAQRKRSGDSFPDGFDLSFVFSLSALLHKLDVVFKVFVSYLNILAIRDKLVNHIALRVCADHSELKVLQKFLFRFFLLVIENRFESLEKSFIVRSKGCIGDFFLGNQLPHDRWKIKVE